MKSYLLTISIFFGLVCYLLTGKKFDHVSIHPTNRESKELLNSGDIVFGKDRELFHASIDLKWLFGVICNKDTWVTIFADALDTVKRLNGNYNSLIKYREIASDLVLKLRYFNQDTPLRVYHHSLVSGQALGLAKKRLIVFYIEESEMNPSLETSEYRCALSDSPLAELLNEQFIFMTSVENHPFAEQVLQAVSDFEDKNTLLSNIDSMNDMSNFGRYRNQDRVAFRSRSGSSSSSHKPPSLLAPRFPLLAVLAPSSDAASTLRSGSSGARWLHRLFFAKAGQFSVVGVANLRRGEITPSAVADWLRAVAHTHGGYRVLEIASPENALFRQDQPHEPPGV